MRMDFTDKVALVTGAGGGLGRCHALQLAERGAKVVVNDLGGSGDGTGSGDAADLVVDEIKAAGGTAIANKASVSDKAGAQSIVDDAVAAFGTVDILVNNAGILRDKTFKNMSLDDFDLVMLVHLTGSAYVTHAAWPIMYKKNYGRIVLTSSGSGLIGNFGQANYSAAKLGIVGLSKSIALDMARFGVTSNCIGPFAWSRMTSSIPVKSDADKERVDRIKSMGAEKIAPVVVALASDAAADVSGQIICVRRNEIVLMSQSRPITALQRNDGWTPTTVLEHAFPAMKPRMYALDRSQDVFNWDPV